MKRLLQSGAFPIVGGELGRRQGQTGFQRAASRALTPARFGEVKGRGSGAAGALGGQDLVGAVLGELLPLAEGGGERRLVGELAVGHHRRRPTGFRMRAAAAMKAAPRSGSAARPWWKGGFAITAS